MLVILTFCVRRMLHNPNHWRLLTVKRVIDV